MDKRNFDSLKGIKAPQAWIEKAAAIPKTAEKRRVIPIYRVTAAASFVLVGLLGLLVFLLYGHNGAPIAVQDRPDATAATEDVGFVGVTESDITQIGTHEETLFPTVGQGSADPRLPTGTPTDTTVDASETQIPPTSATGTEPTEKPTADRPTLTTETTAPTEAPTVPPTAPPVLPTAPPPTNPPATVPPGDCEVYGWFTIDLTDKVSGSGYNVAEELAIYCRMYDENGRLIGDGQLYSPQKEAEILSVDRRTGSVYAYYNPVKSGLVITEGAYEYVFYDIHGNDLYRNIRFVF